MESGGRNLYTQMLARLLPLGTGPFLLCAFLVTSSAYNSARQAANESFESFNSALDHSIQSEAALVAETLAGLQDGATSPERMERLLRTHKGPTLPIKRYWVSSREGVFAWAEPRGDFIGEQVIQLKHALASLNEQGVGFSAIFREEHGFPCFFAVKKLNGDRYLGIEVDLSAWRQDVLRQLRPGPETLIMLTADERQSSYIILNDEQRDHASLFAEIRATETVGGERQIGGQNYLLYSSPLRNVSQQLYVAIPSNVVYADAEETLWLCTLALLLTVVLITVVIWYWSRKLVAPLAKLTDVAKAITDGGFPTIQIETTTKEFSHLVNQLGEMTGGLQQTQERGAKTNKLVMAMFAATNLNDLLKTSVELACTQCGGDMAWFLPAKLGRGDRYGGHLATAGLCGWVYRQGRTAKIDEKEAGELAILGDELRMFFFSIRLANREIGSFRIRFPADAGPLSIGLANSLTDLLDLAISKHEAIRQKSIMSAELDVAESVQKSLQQDSQTLAGLSRLAYHYQPSSRLSGDWFFLIEDPNARGLYVVMGDVVGSGFQQGLTATAVKGSLEMLSLLIRKGKQPITLKPSDIVTMLAGILRQISGVEETIMTCLVAYIDFEREQLSICNAGHALPILIRDQQGVNLALHLHEGEHPAVANGARVEEGKTQNPKSQIEYKDAEYDLSSGDLLLMYSDGLTESKSFKSEVFGRFLMRSLRQRRVYQAPEELRDDILHRFRYYTQGSLLDDDVCFLVLQMPTRKRDRNRNRAS